MAAPIVAMTRDSAGSAQTLVIGSASAKTVGSAKAVTFTWNKTAPTARTMIKVMIAYQ